MFVNSCLLQVVNAAGCRDEGAGRGFFLQGLVAGFE